MRLISCFRSRHLWPVATASPGACIALAAQQNPDIVWDAFQVDLGARTLLSGGNPYLAVDRSGFPWSLLYPIPAVLIYLPLTILPPTLARIAWAALTSGALGYAATKRPVLLTALLSAAFFEALVLGQWSPLLTAAAAVPALGLVWAAKPSVGLALFLAYPSRAAALGIAVLVLLSLAVMPDWPLEWYQRLAAQPHLPPVLRPAGFLLLLGLLRWRRPECRLISALACVPVTPTMYDTLPLFLVCRSRWEGYLLAGLTFVAYFVGYSIAPWQPGQPLEPALARWWPVTFTLVYLPTLLLALRPEAAPKRTATPR